MIHVATRAIQETFEEKGVKFRVKEVGDSSVVEAGFSIDNGPSVVVRFISPDDDNDVAIRIFELISVTEDKRANVQAALNKLNHKYRYLKFVMDDDGDVNVENDLCLCTSNVGPVCFEIFARAMQILDDAYPVMMRALWE